MQVGLYRWDYNAVSTSGGSSQPSYSYIESYFLRGKLCCSVASSGDHGCASLLLLQGMLVPMPATGPDTKPRMAALLRTMCGDLLARVMTDRWDEGERVWGHEQTS